MQFALGSQETHLSTSLRMTIEASCTALSALLVRAPY